MKWIPLILLTVAGFTFNTSEITPIGLLSDIAADLSITEARAGLLISIYAWVVALLSLPLMLLCARMEFRRLMLIIVGIFFVSHIGSVFSTGYWTLLASRIGVACAHSIFWSIAPAMAIAVTPRQSPFDCPERPCCRWRYSPYRRTAFGAHARSSCRLARYLRSSRTARRPDLPRTSALLSRPPA